MQSASLFSCYSINCHTSGSFFGTNGVSRSGFSYSIFPKSMALGEEKSRKGPYFLFFFAQTARFHRFLPRVDYWTNGISRSCFSYSIFPKSTALGEGKNGNDQLFLYFRAKGMFAPFLPPASYVLNKRWSTGYPLQKAISILRLF